MRLPDTIYEALPVVYVGIGLMFIAGASYLGFAELASTLYLALGVASMLTGVIVYSVRRKARRNRSNGPDDPPTA